MRVSSNKLLQKYEHPPSHDVMILIIGTKSFRLKFPGSCYITVLHTHGRNGHYHPHLHVLATSGGYDAQGARWEHLQYLPYDLLRRKWQWHLLSTLRKTLATDAIQLTPCGRTRALARRIPWFRRCILDTQSRAFHQYIPHEIWPHRSPHQ
jgi:hypothetical protein